MIPSDFMTWDRLRLRLVRRRQALGLSQRYVAELIGTQQSHVSDWERSRTIPNVTSLIIWGRALGVELATVDRGAEIP